MSFKVRKPNQLIVIILSLLVFGSIFYTSKYLLSKQAMVFQHRPTPPLNEPQSEHIIADNTRNSAYQLLQTSMKRTMQHHSHQSTDNEKLDTLQEPSSNSVLST